MDNSPYSISRIRTLVRERLDLPADEHNGDHRMNPEFSVGTSSDSLTDAAVLIGLVERREGVCLLLTKRAEQLNSHSGQIAFPGGKIDADDVSPEAAALREAREEIDLDQRAVEIIGRLPDYYSGSGFRIVPVLGIINPKADYAANPQEVDYVFEVPLEFLMNTDNHRTGSRRFEGKERFYLEMPYGEHFIWGVTAGMIRVLHDRVFA